MHRGSRIQATDGPAGQADEILVDPVDGRITHLAATRQVVERTTNHDFHVTNHLYQRQRGSLEA
jgi:hypothetical protein